MKELVKERINVTKEVEFGGKLSEKRINREQKGKEVCV